MSPALINIRQRAHLLKEARAFFSSRNVLEVDPCALSPYAPIDSNIDVISAQVSDTEKGFLHTSPAKMNGDAFTTPSSQWPSGIGFISPFSK